MARRRWLLFLLWFLWPVVLVDISGPPMVDSVLLASYRLVNHGTFALSDNADPQIVSQVASFDISFHNGRVYSGVAPGASLIAVPFYALAAPLFRHFDDTIIKSPRVLNYYWNNSSALGLPREPHLRDCYLLQISLVWLLIAPLFAAFGVRFTSWLEEIGCARLQAIVIGLALGFGTMALFYASMFDRQILAYLLAWHALLTLARAGVATAQRSTQFLFVGVLLALAISVEYASIFLVVLSLLFFLPKQSWLHRALVLAPIATCGLGIALYHHSLFGSALSTPYQHRFWLQTEQFARQGIDPSTFEKGLLLGNPPSVAVMAQLTFGTYKGLFLYSPILLLGLWGLVRGLSKKHDWQKYAYCLAVFVVYLVLNSTMGTHLPGQFARSIWGGLSILWGPRHLFAALPFLVYGLTRLDWRNLTMRWVIAVALVASITINVLGCLFKQPLMTTPAVSAELQSPIVYVTALFQKLGARVTLLDAYQVLPAFQTMMVLLLLAVSLAIVWGEWKSPPIPP